MLFRLRLTLIAGGMLFASFSAHAACQGRDLWPELKTEKPSVAAEIERQAAAMPFSKGKLFKITKDGLQPSYIFGTIHTADPKATAFSPSLLAAVDGARVAAFELEEVGSLNDSKAMEKLGGSLLRYMLPQSGERLDDLFDTAQIEEIKNAIVPYGMPKEAAGVLKPAFLGILLSVPACLRDDVAMNTVDGALALRAKGKNIRVVGLETIEEQLESMTAFSPAVQKEMLLQAVKAAPMGADAFATMVSFYGQGELGLLLTWTQHPAALSGDEESAPPKEIMEGLIDKRNIRMRDRALPYLAKGGVFIGVGAGHLPGDKGLLRLVEASGYKVEKVE